MDREELPPSLHFQRPNTHIDFAKSPFRVIARRTPWRRRDGAPRRAAISAFGFSGTNVHVVLEEAPVAAVRVAEVERPVHVLALSARTEPALHELAGRYEQHLGAAAEPFADVCHTANAGRAHFEHRLALIAENAEDARRKLAILTAALGWGIWLMVAIFIIILIFNIITKAYLNPLNEALKEAL